MSLSAFGAVAFGSVSLESVSLGSAAGAREVIALSPETALSPEAVLSGNAAFSADAVFPADAMARFNRQFSAAVVIPSYESLTERTDLLVSSSDRFLQSPSEATLATLRADFARATLAWSQSSAFAFGPVHSLGYSAALETPVDQAGVDRVVMALPASAQLSDLEDDRLHASLQGFEAIAYLLQSQKPVKSAADFSVQERLYVHYLTRQADAATQALLTVWQAGWNGNPAYETVLASAGTTGNNAYLSPGAATEEIIRGLINRLDVVTQEELPALLEEAAADTADLPTQLAAVQQLGSVLQGVQLAYTAGVLEDSELDVSELDVSEPEASELDVSALEAEPMGLSQLVAIANPQTDAQIQAALSAALESVAIAESDYADSDYADSDYADSDYADSDYADSDYADSGNADSGNADSVAILVTDTPANDRPVDVEQSLSTAMDSLMSVQSLLESDVLPHAQP
ncbi:MAG: imelysin family protein [Cyanobacteria bacterium J06634_5]